MSTRILLSVTVGDTVTLDRVRDIAAELVAYVEAVVEELVERGVVKDGELIADASAVISMGAEKSEAQSSGRWKVGRKVGA